MGEVEKLFNTKPKTPAEIKAWVKYFLGVTISDHCRCKPKTPEDRPHTSQLDYVSGAFFNEYSSCVYMACRNGGKSAMAGIVDVLDAHFKPNIRIAVTAFTREQADFIRLKIVEYLTYLEKKTGIVLATCLKDIINFSNGSVIRFFSGAKSDANVTGWRPHVLQLDEADKWEQKRVDGVANCLEGGGTIPSRFDLLSTNYTLSGEGVVLKMVERYEDFNRTKFPHMLPAKIFVSCLLDVLVECGNEFQCDKCPLWDFCKGAAKMGGGGYFRIEEAINKLSQNSRPSFEAEYMLWRPSSEISYFTNFSIASNVKDEIPFDPSKETIAVFDFGGSRCPHAALVIQRDKPKDRNDVPTYYVVDEFLGMGLLEHLIGSMKGKYSRILDSMCYCDPAGNRTEQNRGAQSNVQTLRRAGFHPRFRQLKRRQTFEMIFQLIQPASGPPKLFIAKKCVNLVKQIQAAEHETHHGKPTPEPADGEGDDLLDCLRMAVGNTLGTYARHNGSNTILRYFSPR